MSNCPDENLLAAYLDRSLTPERQRKLEAHLVECDLCRRTVALAIMSKETVSDPAYPNPTEPKHKP